jgi:Resolvase, N terminal domain
MTTKRRKTTRPAARAKRRLRPAAPKVRARSSDAGEITSKPMLIGYARVSTVDQNLALQRDALTEAGCAKIFTEQMSGAVTDRPALHDALEFARSGDTLIVWKLDRLARSMKQLIETVETLRLGPVTTKLCKVAIRGDRCVGSASASRRLGYLSPEASLSAMLGVQTAGEGLVRLENAKVLDT